MDIKASLNEETTLSYHSGISSDGIEYESVYISVGVLSGEGHIIVLSKFSGAELDNMIEFFTDVQKARKERKNSSK